MPLDVQVVERQPVPDGMRFWDVVTRMLPLALAPTAARLQLRAPRGKTGKLARRVDVRAVRVSQGFVQGVEAQFIVPVRYGHLVTGGHRIIPRGPARGVVIGSKTVIRNRLRGGFVASESVSMPVRETRGVALRRRLAAGSIGFVPGNPFALQTVAEDRAALIQRIETGLGSLRAV